MNTPPEPDLNAFNALVWEIVKQIPPGIVTTYGQIASMIPPLPDVSSEDYDKLSPRWVGYAMNAVSVLDDGTIPWWRVINSKGGISLPEGSQSARQQRQRLEEEGLVFNEKAQVSLNLHGWEGPPSDWREQRGLLPPRPLKTAKPESDTPQQMSLF